MKKSTPLFSLLFFFLFSVAGAQSLHIVTLTANNFSPSSLTIATGDTVRWVNTQGIHDVTADDNSFNSGSPAGPPWQYERIFSNTGTVRYYCSVHGGVGGIGMSGILTVVLSTGIAEKSSGNFDFKLDNNYPNPFTSFTTINYSIPSSGNVEIIVYDMLGQQVRVLEEGHKTTGKHTIRWNGKDEQGLAVSTGTYFVRMEYNNLFLTRKISAVSRK